MSTEDAVPERPVSRPNQDSALITGAERAAYAICQRPIDLTGRKEVEGFAIDAADPDSPMDRDDAIGIRYGNDPARGHLTTLDISIADVASVSPHVGKRNRGHNLAALDAFSRKNGESLYFPHGVSPMLPRQMQDRLSLENGKVRPTITISVTFDRQGNRIHTEFARTYIKAKCQSYRDAARDMLLPGNLVRQISVFVNGLLGRENGVTHFPHYDAQTGTYTDAEGNARHISRDEVSAFTTVQGSMITTNEAAADVMSESPFLFRNHSYSYRNGPEFYRKEEMEQYGEGTGRILQNKAEYSPHCKGHFGLNVEKYSHVTSPMRRYADLVNQRMMGWAIDVVDAVTQSATADPAWDHAKFPPEKISYVVWDHARELLGKASALAKRGAKKITTEKALEETIAGALQELPGILPAQASRIAKSAATAIGDIEIPYSKKQLEKISAELNETLANNRNQRREMQFDETENWLNAVFSNPDGKKLKAWSAGHFARLLEAAARRGDNNDIFAHEVLQRLESDKETLIANLHSILVVAERYKDSRWQELKKQALQKLKDDSFEEPGALKSHHTLAEELFEYTQKAMAAQSRQDDHGNPATPSNDKLYFLEATLIDKDGKHIPSALAVLSHANQDYSAPIIDTAGTPEKARQGAMLTFFRYYGELSPHQEMYTPKLIDLALERAKVQKGGRFALLEKMCGEYFTIDIQKRTTQDPQKPLEITLSVTNKTNNQTITKLRAGAAQKLEEIIDKAAKLMLANQRFLDMLSQCHRAPEADGKTAGNLTEIPGTALWSNAHTARVIDRRPPAQR